MATHTDHQPAGSHLTGVRPTISAFGLASFLVGAAVVVRVNVVGEATLCELLLPLLGLAAVMTGGGSTMVRERSFQWVLLALIVSLAGYGLSDLIRATPQEQYLRGWGRIGLLLCSFASLSLVSAADRRSLWWFALGCGLGGVLYFRLVVHMPISMWKFDFNYKPGYAEPFTLAVLCIAALFPPRLRVLPILGVAALSVVFDFRSLGAIVFLVAAIVWIRSARPHLPMRGTPRVLQLIFSVMFAVVVANLAIGLTESDWHKQRRGASNEGRLAGLEFGVNAILHSPIVGAGSWGNSAELAAIEDEILAERAQDGRPIHSSGGSSFATHSSFLQSWIEGGVLGAAFFMVLAIQLLKGLKLAALNRPFDALSPLLYYYMLMAAWHLAMSPFAATTRLQFAVGSAAAVLVTLESRARQAVTKQDNDPATVSSFQLSGIRPAAEAVRHKLNVRRPRSTRRHGNRLI